MCGGFTCSKNALTALNILYIVVAFILIGVAVYGRATPLGENLPIIGGILACGVFLILISILGLIGAIKHHQVLLFFYMLILFLLFLVQFSVACACLAVNQEQQQHLAKQGWNKIENTTTQMDLETVFKCCGFDKGDNTTFCPDLCNTQKCSKCGEALQNTIDYAFKLSGGIGLFFSFTEIIAAVVAYRYRNQMNPKDKASAINVPRYNSYLY
ncbi:tetraspanin-13 isoform X1 [Schistocerca piceifrons]|uniref:tetraspanin-13 isoform X1 n=1 Tax=Schistocerca piceifrons TaxID=274613 RepID=UPI001F5FDC5D|nr:tetraspanin-13 isoform X1 [Schistocerca piceifrons]XP_049946028.1 tetraspanin-13 isoform X1 [Schistocerca serialis cubense]